MRCKRQPIEYRAYGKVNLALSVLGKRKDGYHDVVTIMASIQEHDVLTFHGKTQGLQVLCPAMPQLQEDENLVYKAAKAVMARSRSSTGLCICVDKNIPAGAGLGGGSSDAACTLLAVNQLLAPEHRLSLNTLMELAVGLGADVSFFLGCNSPEPLWTAAKCRGTGHIVQPINDPGIWLVIAVPNVYVDTRWAYATFDLAERQIPEVEAISPVEGHNDLEDVVSTCYPEIQLCKRYLLQSGANKAMMTGSGAGVFGICDSYNHATDVKTRFMSMADLPLRFVAVTRTGRGDRND